MKSFTFLRLFMKKSSPLTNVISKCHYILPPKPVTIKPLPPKPRLRPGKAQKKKLTSSDLWTVVGYSTAEHYNLLALSEKMREQVRENPRYGYTVWKFQDFCIITEILREIIFCGF